MKPTAFNRSGRKRGGNKASLNKVKKIERRHVSSFLRQPARTRSGIVYSKKSRLINSSAESIFGSVSECVKDKTSSRAGRNHSRSCQYTHDGLSIVLKTIDSRKSGAMAYPSSGVRTLKSVPRFNQTGCKSSTKTKKDKMQTNSKIRKQVRGNEDNESEHTRLSKKRNKVKWQSLSKIVKDLKKKRAQVPFPSGSVKPRKRPSKKKNLNVAPMPRCGITRGSKKLRKTQKEIRKKSANRKRRHAKKNELLGDRPSKKRRKHSRKARLDVVPTPRHGGFTKYRHESARKNDLNIIPMPSHGTSKKNDDNWKSMASSKYRSTKKSEKLRKELNNMEMSSMNDKTPFPSSRVPTFIAMVKTAIRDLGKFHMTSRKAISKYIELRYRVRNDDLLKFALKWMSKLCVLAKNDGLYYFTTKRVIKNSKDIAKVRGKGRKSASKKKKRKRKRNKKNKKSKKRSKRNGKKKKKCTCSKDVDREENLVKMKTRYVRRNGRIYKQDEYV